MAAHALPVRAFDESAFEDGLGFDGSSIRGWQGISESDMLLMPQAETAIIDPATEAPTLSLVCEVIDPVTREPYAKDPRQVARRAEEHLRASGIADTAYFGPECEFFVFDEVHYELGPNRSHYSVDSAEGYWNSGTPGLGYTARPKEVLPRDALRHAPRPPQRDGAHARAARGRVSSTTTRSPRAANARSTSASRRSPGWPTR